MTNPDTRALQALADKVEAGKVTQWFNWLSGVKGHGTNARLAYCGDRNAAMALRKAVLPGWRAVMRETDEGWFVRLESPEFKSVTWEAGGHVRTDILAGSDVSACGKDLARTELLAILRALIAGGRE